MANKKLPDHHRAWLEAHPHRSEAWLRERTADGFDLHHIDGDCENNEPDNLVLIECTDHMWLHGGRTLRRLNFGPTRPIVRRQSTVMAYWLEGKTNKEIAALMTDDYYGKMAARDVPRAVKRHREWLLSEGLI